MDSFFRMFWCESTQMNPDLEYPDYDPTESHNLFNQEESFKILKSSFMAECLTYTLMENHRMVETMVTYLYFELRKNTDSF